MNLQHYERNMMKNMMRFKLKEMYKIEMLQDEFQLQEKVTFDSHLNLEQEDQMIDEIMQQLSIDESFTFMRERDKDSIKD